MVDKVERLTDLILALLDTSRPLSLNELADQIPGYPPVGEARRMAFERDKRLLREEGIIIEAHPLDGEAQMGYRIDADTFFLPDLDLSSEEQAALHLAVAGVHLADDSGGALSLARRRPERVPNSSPFLWGILVPPWLRQGARGRAKLPGRSN